MQKRLLYIFFLLIPACCLAQDEEEEAIPSSYISRELNDTLTIGNSITLVSVWAEKDGLYIKSDSAIIKIMADPCVWDFGYREVLNYGNGYIQIKNPYVKLTIFVQRDSPAIWIKGSSGSEISVIKNGNAIIDSKGMGESSKKNFTLRVSSGDIERMNYKKAFNRNTEYWNELWQRSYIVLRGADSSLTKTYNERRWENVLSGKDLHFLIRSGDWDAFKTHIARKEENLSTLALMIEYFKYSNNESYLHSHIVPLAEKLLPKKSESPYYGFICDGLRRLPDGVMIPHSLIEIITSVGQNNFSFSSDPLQRMVDKEDFQTDIFYKIWMEGECYKKGVYNSKKKRSKIIHQDIFL